MGGSFTSSGSSSSSQAQISPDQLPFLKNLWEQATQQFESQQGQDVGGQAQDLLNGILPGAQQGLDQALNAGQALSPFTDPNNELAQQQIDLAGQDISNNLNNNILPGLTNSAIGGGNLGGSRGAISAGLATQGAQNSFAQASTGIRSNIYGQAQQAAGQQGALNLAGGQAALEGSGQLYNLGLSPLNAAWGPLQQFASILGRPTVLNESQSDSSSLGFGF